MPETAPITITTRKIMPIVQHMHLQQQLLFVFGASVALWIAAGKLVRKGGGGGGRDGGRDGGARVVALSEIAEPGGTNGEVGGASKSSVG